MLFSRSSFTAIVAAIALSSTDAFMVRLGPGAVAVSPFASISPTYTMLYSTNEDGAANDDESVNAKSQKPSPGSDNDILNSPAFLTRKLDVLKSDLASLEEQLQAEEKRLEEGKAEWASQIDDLDKEYKTIQQRMNTQSKSGDNMATIQVTRELLQVLDTYDRAFGSVTAESESDKSIVDEYKKAYDMILETFKKLGVVEVATVGTEFNYELHQAVMQKPSEEFEEGFVSEELQKGFKIGDELVRAAMVVVAA